MVKENRTDGHGSTKTIHFPELIEFDVFKSEKLFIMDNDNTEGKAKKNPLTPDNKPHLNCNS